MSPSKLLVGLNFDEKKGAILNALRHGGLNDVHAEYASEFLEKLMNRLVD